MPDLETLFDIAPRGICTTRELARAGIERPEVDRLLARGDIVRVARGAYARPAPSTPEGAYLARVHAALRASPRAVLTGPAALVVMGLPILNAPTVLHAASARRGGPGPRSQWVPVAPHPNGQVAVVDGITTVGAPAAILDTARLVSLATAVAAADAALRRGLVSRPDLEHALAQLGPVTGVNRARTCVSLADPGSESPGESWSAVILHEHSIAPPRRQAVFEDDDGFVARVDFWWDDAGVVGEYDGRIKYARANPSGRSPEEVVWAEKKREDRIRALGQDVVRWTAADLHRPARWLTRLRRALSSSGRVSGAPAREGHAPDARHS